MAFLKAANNMEIVRKAKLANIYDGYPRADPAQA